MRRIFASVVVAIVLAVGAFLAWSWHGELPPQKPSTASFDPAIVATFGPDDVEELVQPVSDVLHQASP